MNQKEHNRRLAYDALILLAVLALLTFISRLWPILLLILLGIFAAMIRLLFLSSKKTEEIAEEKKTEPEHIYTEHEVQNIAYSLIQKRITNLVLNQYPEARWIWETPRTRERIEHGEDVFILLNGAGGYRRAKVVIQNLKVLDLVFISSEPSAFSASQEKTADNQETNHPVPEYEESETPVPENFELLAFEWVEKHILELNERCNEAIAQKESAILVSAAELPAKDAWENICKELIRAGLEDTSCIEDGIQIKIKQ